MKIGRIRLVLVLVALASLLVAPAAARANSYMVERGILGMSVGAQYDRPLISGDSIFYGSRASAPGSLWQQMRYNLVTGANTVFCSDATHDILDTRVSGDWAVWMQNFDIKAKNLKTGVVKSVTSDGGLRGELQPVISGTYVVWESVTDGGPNFRDLKGKNLATTGSPFTVAGGTSSQSSPSIYGMRVAYLDDSNGYPNVRVKTIGSSALPLRITDNDRYQMNPVIGDHLVVWLVVGAEGRDVIRYYDYNTGLTYDGPSDPFNNLANPHVSGDRILYSLASDLGRDVYVYDTRVARVSEMYLPAQLACTSSDEYGTSFVGNEVAYTDGDFPTWGRLVVPSVSLNSVPTRISRGGHIHLTGSISDQGHRIGGARIGFERYVSGKWRRYKTVTAGSTGTFSFQTPKTYSKTVWRVVYDGAQVLFGAPARNHFSTVSGTRTAWPR